MRDLHVITDTDRRGAQVFAMDLTRALHGTCDRVVALTQGSQASRLDVRHLGPSRLHPLTLRALRRDMARADVVVAHGSSTLVACVTAGAGLRVPVVYRQISEQAFWASTPARRARVRLYLSQVSHVVALWRGAAETLRDGFGVPAGRVSILPNAVPAHRFGLTSPEQQVGARRSLGLGPERPVVLSIGALVPEKGVDLTVRAMQHLPSAQLLVVGDGPERATLERLAQQAAPGRARFCPPQRDPRVAYAAADVLSLPSRGGDSMPAVLIEAGLQGLPAVATPVEGIVDIVQDGSTGRLLAAPEPETLARALHETWQRAADWGPAGREHCLARFDVRVVAEQWRRLLEDQSAETT